MILNKEFQPPEPGAIIKNQEGKEYRIGEPIGSGNFGNVYDCQDHWGNSLVAKVLVPRGHSYEQVQKNWSRELDNLILLRHPNITYIYDGFECNDTFYLIIEGCASSVNELLEHPDFRGEFWLKPIARCVLQAINFMHSANYVHKDLHGGNVFASLTYDEMMPSKEPTMQFKVGDFGISKLISDVNIFGTVLAQWMLPPEYIDHSEFGPLDCRVDIYHAALLFLSLLRGKKLTFTVDQTINGVPRKEAESLESPYGSAIARALRRHVNARTPTALDFWKDLTESVN